MNPSSLIPAPDIMPVGSGWFTMLLLLTFMGHLVLMNTVLGTCIITLIQGIRHTPGHAGRASAAAHVVPTGLALTINFGVAPLLFLQVLYGQFLYSSSILMAWYWLSVVGFGILAYYGVYLYQHSFKNTTGGATWILGLATLFMLYIGFIFTNNMSLMLQPHRWAEYAVTPSGTMLNLADPVLLPRWLHFMTAATALGGLSTAVLSQVKKMQKKLSPDEANDNIRVGLTWFTRATVVQLAVGPWFLFTLPAPLQTMFTGGSMVHTIHLAAGILLGLGALGAAWKGKVWIATGLTLGAMGIMVVVRHMLRQAYLAPWSDLASLPVTEHASGYQSLLLFLFSLALGGALILYMCKLCSRSRVLPAPRTGEEN